jgi:nitrous oxidase accessory protein NosD
VTGGDVGIAFHGDIHGVIDDNVVQDPKRVGIMLFLWRIGGRAEATVTSNRVINAGEIGILLIADSGQVLHNTIVGPTPVDRTEHGPDGILFLGTEGRLAQNTVSGHFNDHPEGRACGIRLGADAGEIAVSGNHFPSPGNEVDLCDERASGAAAATPVATPVMGG